MLSWCWEQVEGPAVTRQPCAPLGIKPAVRNHQMAGLNTGHCKNCIIGNGLYALRESSQACLWRWLSSSQIPLESFSSRWGFSPCLMLISPTQCAFFSVHPRRSPCLLPSPAAAQIHGLCLQSGQMESVEYATVPVPRPFGWKDLLVPSLPAYVVKRGHLGWKMEHPRSWGP